MSEDSYNIPVAAIAEMADWISSGAMDYALIQDIIFQCEKDNMSDSDIVKHLKAFPEHRDYIVQNMSPELSAALEILEL